MEFLMPMLSYALPLLGKLLLMIPVIPNKVIPFILGAFNVAHKYWVLAGFPIALESGSLGGEMHYAGFSLLSAVPVVWGMAEQYLFHSFYEGRKAKAKIEGKVSWWEKGKRSIF